MKCLNPFHQLRTYLTSSASRRTTRFVIMAIQTKRNKNWSSQEIKCLFCIWAENYVDLTRNKRNRPFYNRMSEQMQKLGFTRSHSEIQQKVRNLTTLYRSEKTVHGCTATGYSPSQWPYFGDVHQILGNSHNPLLSERLEPATRCDIDEMVVLTSNEENEITAILDSTDTEQTSNASLISRDKDSEEEDVRREAKRRKTSREKIMVIEKMLKQMEETNQKMISLMEINTQLLKKIVEKL